MSYASRLLSDAGAPSRGPARLSAVPRLDVDVDVPVAAAPMRADDGWRHDAAAQRENPDDARRLLPTSPQAPTRDGGDLGEARPPSVAAPPPRVDVADWTGDADRPGLAPAEPSAIGGLPRAMPTPVARAIGAGGVGPSPVGMDADELFSSPAPAEPRPAVATASAGWDDDASDGLEPAQAVRTIGQALVGAALPAPTVMPELGDDSSDLRRARGDDRSWSPVSPTTERVSTPAERVTVAIGAIEVVVDAPPALPVARPATMPRTAPRTRSDDPVERLRRQYVTWPEGR